MSRVLSLFWKYNLPRWSILIIDLAICAFSLTLAFFLRFDFKNYDKIPLEDRQNLPYDYLILLSIRAFSFILSKTYKGVVRYTSSKDAARIFAVVIIGSVLMVIANVISLKFVLGYYVIPTQVIVVDALITLFFMISSRLAVKAIYFESKNPEKNKINILIYGAGEAGIITKRTLDRDAAIKYKVVGFIDDNEGKKGRSLEGVFIYPPSKMDDLLKENSVENLIISVQNLPPARKNEITDWCLNHNVKVLNVPPVAKWINGELSFNQIKGINIEDLLERDPIKLDNDIISSQIKGKVILITGAAGSIGSELSRQCMKFAPKKIIMLDQAESPLHDVEIEFASNYKKESFETVIGDVRNKDRMHNVFNTFKPQMVFHAAAYKHVPMMENNPSESILNNILGTKNTADLAVEFNAEKFVFVSTDKAVNPTNVMGASKRIAEIYIQSLGKKSKTKFITTRLQIENREPITITHPDITRYFMTIPESCQLVLEAGALGKGGEIFVFDMGRSIKIVDLARKMIKLSGLEEGKDIQIVYTGLRPGEKLFEELLADTENTLPTHHSQILIGKVREYEYEQVSEVIKNLIGLFDTQDNEKIVQCMKTLVPEFKSNNSVFEKLDER